MGCYNCRGGKELPCKLRPSTIPICKDEVPKIVNGCPTCRKEIPKCHLRPLAIPLCEEEDALNENTGCLKCRKKEKKCRAVSFCKPSQKVELTDGCPNCRERHHCDTPAGLVKKKNCFKLAHGSKSATRDCEDWEIPKRHNSSCCLSCIPKRHTCSAAVKAECKKKVIPVCKSIEEYRYAFNSRTCCQLCSKPETPNSGKPTGNKCTKAQFEKAMKEAPVCKQGQTPLYNKAKWCGPSCTNPKRQCKNEQVVACQSQQRTCGANEKPAFVKGECCCNCRKAKPTCQCKHGKTCARYIQNNVEKEHCVGVGKNQTFKMIISNNKDLLGMIKKMNNRSLALVLSNIMERYCEQVGAECDGKLSQTLDTLRVAVLKNTSDGVEFTTSVNSSFLEKALNDSLATGPEMITKKIFMPTPLPDTSYAQMNLCSFFIITSFIILEQLFS